MPSFISVQTNTHPFLQLDGSDAPAKWNEGRLYRIGLLSRFVRVNPRGVQYRVAQGDVFVHPSKSWWRSAACALVAEGMCEQRGRGGAGMLVFPSSKVDIPDNLQLLTGYEEIEYLREIVSSNRTCMEPHANRELVLRDPRNRYELSLCDLMENELDVVLDLKTERMFWRFGGNSMAFYIFVASVAIFLVSALADNVKNILEPSCRSAKAETRGADAAAVDGEEQNDRPHSTHAVSRMWMAVYDAVVVTTVAFLCWNWNRTLHLLVTEDDVVLYYVMHIFVLLHFVVFVRDEWRGWTLAGVAAGGVFGAQGYRQLPVDAEKLSGQQRVCPEFHRSVRGVSFLTAILLCLSVHVHASFNNAYAWILTTLFGVRSVHKMLKCMSSKEGVLLLTRVMHVWDFWVWMCLVTFAVAAGSESETAGQIAVFEVVFVCLVAGYLLCVKEASSTLERVDVL